MTLGRNQHVTRINLACIHERQRVLVFVHDGGRDFLRNDAAEDAIAHITLRSFSTLLIAAAWYLVKRAVFQTQRAQLAAPHAAAIERGEAHAELEPQRRPVAANE